MEGSSFTWTDGSAHEISMCSFEHVPKAQNESAHVLTFDPH